MALSAKWTTEERASKKAAYAIAANRAARERRARAGYMRGPKLIQESMRVEPPAEAVQERNVSWATDQRGWCEKLMGDPLTSRAALSSHRSTPASLRLQDVDAELEAHRWQCQTCSAPAEIDGDYCLHCRLYGEGYSE